MALHRNRILCLEESIWSDNDGLSDKTSVLPTLQTLHGMGVATEYAHRHVLGPIEFENYLSWRLGPRVRTYGTIYLAFHGSSKGLRVGDEDISLNRVAELIGEFPGGVVHLGSCSVLRDQDNLAREFLDATGAALISGYERDADWLDCAALETAWLGYLAQYERVGDARRYFEKRYESLINRLEWQAHPI